MYYKVGQVQGSPNLYIYDTAISILYAASEYIIWSSWILAIGIYHHRSAKQYLGHYMPESGDNNPFIY